MIAITDLKEFRQLETGQCKAAIYFDETKADVFFTLKKWLKEGKTIQLVSMYDYNMESTAIEKVQESNPRLDMLCASMKTALAEAYEEGREAGLAQKETEETESTLLIPKSRDRDIS